MVDDDFVLEQVRFFDDGQGPYPILALEAYPDIATRVAVLLACFGTAEIRARDLIAKILDISQDEAGAVIGHMNSMAARFTTVSAIANTAPDSPTKASV